MKEPMSAIATPLLLLIEERRQALISEAHSLISTWFDNDTDYKYKRRFYSPHIKVQETDSQSDSVSIFWKRRTPVNNWQGKTVTVRGITREVKVMTTHVPARKKGPAYPITSFPAAPEDERADILALEAALSPIRAELAFLGKQRRQFTSFYGKVAENPSEALEQDGSDDLTFTRPEIGGEATW
ncbi:MAG: hypothetical protein F8N36_13820 [Desulfovibrio sp.]|uniref:conjugative transfer protein MobI(A/C) n=1 Tax=Desulfovibrio sp. TaxID=885 RepID=UPI00135D5924|nr:conjugative transfer protein MobI(A/C) [Desulfovibrio sp.]MTJ93916.1 hypothetical protein [Desulfovibrio sp.]